MADDQAPDEGQEAVVETGDGAEHTGVLPASAELRSGWFRSPAGSVAHADGPGQVTAFTGRGWTPIGEDEARDIVASGVGLTVSRTDTAGTFDAESVTRAVRDEAPAPKRADRKRAARAKPQE